MEGNMGRGGGGGGDSSSSITSRRSKCYCYPTTQWIAARWAPELAGRDGELKSLDPNRTCTQTPQLFRLYSITLLTVIPQLIGTDQVQVLIYETNCIHT
jgi:hypothetical protein